MASGRQQSPAAVTVPLDDRRLDRSVLEEEREFFVRSLRDLEAERAAGDIDDLDYQSLRDDYTVRAAEVVRRLAAIDVPAGAAVVAPAGAGEAVSAGPSTGPDPAADGTSPEPGPVASEVDGPGRPRRTPAPVAGRRRRRGFIAAAALIVIGGVTFAVVGLLSQPSESTATRVNKLDVAALVEAGKAASGHGQYSQAVKDYEAALRLQPTNVLTLTGEGELLVEIGGGGHDQDALSLGLTRLQSAEIADPSYGPAYGARGIGYYDEGDYAAAVPQFETYLADTPKASWSPAIESELAAAKKKLAAKG